MRKVTEDERTLLNHVTMFGSDGYPVTKLGRVWVWGTEAVKGPPTVFKTKREAVASFEAFLDVLRDALGEEARERALRERAEIEAFAESERNNAEAHRAWMRKEDER